MAKTQFLQIRLSPEDRARVDEAAKAEFLDASTWARQAIFRALAVAETRRAHEQNLAAGT